MVELADAAMLEAADRRSVLHPFTMVDAYAAGQTPPQLIVESAEGIRVRDQHGNELIDAFSSLYCVNVGYGQQRIVDAMTEQARRLPFFHVFAGVTHQPAVELAETLLRIAGPRMKRVFFGSSGSDANDTQVKLVWYANNVRGMPRKKKIISRKRGYHGGTIVTASLTALPIYLQGFDILSDIVRQTLAPDLFWSGESDPATFVQQCVDHLEELIAREGADTIGAFIAEPMIGAGGAVPPPDGYWPAIQAVLRKHDILLILDEVVTAFGRVGHMLGCQRWGIEPDLITLAKGLTSAYAPLSAVLVGETVWDALQQGSAKHGIFGHGYTYTAHPLGAAAAIANIAVIEDDDLCGNVRTVGPVLFDAVRKHFDGEPLVGEIREAGMFGAIEFVAEGEPRPPSRPGAQVRAAGQRPRPRGGAAGAHHALRRYHRPSPGAGADRGGCLRDRRSPAQGLPPRTQRADPGAAGRLGGMSGHKFITLDVFTDTRFGGNPLAVFPDADDLDGATMQALASEFNMSEVAFVQSPADPRNTARIRIFTSEMEIGFAGHPNVGVGWVLGNAGRDVDGLLRFEEGAGLVEVAVERADGQVIACRVGAPQPLTIGEPPSHAEVAACASLPIGEVGEPVLASAGLATVCVEVSPAALGRAKCNVPAFEAIAARRPDLGKICLLLLYSRDGATIRARMFAPLSGTIEDPATGSAICALTALLLNREGGDHLSLDVTQGVEMGRPSRMTAEARRMTDGIRAWVSGGCVPVLKGELV